MKMGMLTRIIILFCISLLSWNTEISYPHSDQHIADNNITSQICDSSESGQILPQQGEISVPRNTTVSNRTRTNAQLRRPGGNIISGKIALSKNGSIRNINNVSTFRSILERFPSGLEESTHHLIYLGKLII